MAGGRIVARDLAAALPAFLAVPPETPIAPAPLPGSQRVFREPEILTLARRFSLPLTSAPPVCFEWRMAPLDRNRAMEAMRASLGMPSAQIRIDEVNTYPVPPGRIEFPIDRINPPAGAQRAAVLWRGDVIFGDNNRFAIWARVAITGQCPRLIAVESLRAGQPIAARQVRAESAACFPLAAKDTPDPAGVAGMVPVRMIAARSEIHADMLVPPNDVNRGEAVRVEVYSGAAVLAFTGQAVSSGRNGDMITVRNPDSKRTFQARVAGKGKAIVQADQSRGI